MRSAGPVVLVVALSACNFSSDWGGTSYRCNADRDCPSGFVCSDEDMLCHAPPGDGGAGDGGPAGDSCGAVGVLDGSFAASRWGVSWGDVAWTASAGGLTATLQGSEPEEVQGAFGTNREYYLADGDAVWLSASGLVPDLDVSARLAFHLEERTFEVGVTNGLLTVAENDGGGTVTRYSGPYDAADDRYWRIARAGDELVASVSADGDAWMELLARPIADPVERVLVQPRIFVNAAPDQASDVVLSFTQLEATPSRRCLVAELVDDFGDPERDPVWDFYDGTGGACGVDQATGVLRFTADASAGECGYRTRIGFDPNESALTFEVTEPGVAGAPTFEAAMVDVDDGVYHFYVDGDPRQLTMGVPAMGAVTLPFEDTRWLRMRDAGDTLYFEASVDGLDWEARAVFDELTLGDDMRVFLNAQGGTGTIEIDNVGLPPGD